MQSGFHSRSLASPCLLGERAHENGNSHSKVAPISRLRRWAACPSCYLGPVSSSGFPGSAKTRLACQRSRAELREACLNYSVSCFLMTAGISSVPGSRELGQRSANSSPRADFVNRAVRGQSQGRCLPRLSHGCDGAARVEVSSLQQRTVACRA